MLRRLAADGSTPRRMRRLLGAPMRFYLEWRNGKLSTRRSRESSRRSEVSTASRFGGGHRVKLAYSPLSDEFVGARVE